MTAATSAELLAELVERGASLRAIGDAIGRDSSLLSQIRSGRKSGANLADALSKLRDDLAGVSRTDAAAAARAASVPEPTRRRTGRGEVARVRRRTVYRADTGWATGSVKAQAAKSGARSMAPLVRDAARGGGNVVVALTVAPHGKELYVVPQSPKARAKAQARGGMLRVTRPTRVEMKLDPERFDQAIAASGGDVTAAAWLIALEDGYLTGEDIDAGTNVDAVEVKTW